MKSACFLLAALAALAASPLAQAQYEWLDDNGRHVFSDQMPPSNIPVERILNQPEPARHAPARPAQAADTPAGEAQAADQADVAADPEPVASQEAQAQAKNGAQPEADARQQAVRADNCRRARQAKRTLEAGMRVARINEAGERVVMDDAQRAAELKRANEVIDSAC